jgi:ABC-type Mn2+/Zn2+ transport system permease subunit
VRPFGVEFALLVLLAVAVLVGAQGLGNLLVVASMIAPAVTARALTKRVLPMVAVAAAVGVAAGAGGLYLSYHAGVAAGAAVSGLLVAIAAMSHAAQLSRRGWRARQLA